MDGIEAMDAPVSRVGHPAELLCGDVVAQSCVARGPPVSHMGANPVDAPPFT